MSLDYLNDCIRLRRKPVETKFRHSSVHYIKALLEDKFKRTFSLEEVEGLIRDELGWKE